jgi:hypothetical protein
MNINDLIAAAASGAAVEVRERMGVYVIVNKITLRAYIGQTRNFSGRCRAHFSALRVGRHSNAALQADWAKYGEAAFLFCPLLEVGAEALLAEESRLIAECSFPYNTDELVPAPSDRGQGRKPIQEGADTVTVSLRMTTSQRDKLQRLGGAAWVRERIDKAKG